MIRIRSKHAGFRRAGVAHPAGPVDHPDDAFTSEQLAALKAEAMLVVEEIRGPGAAPLVAEGGAGDENPPEVKPKKGNRK
jgi:hypothetical protein